MELIGSINRYKCTDPRCGWYVNVALLSSGTTPFCIRCRGCGGDAQSSCYRVENVKQLGGFFYRPHRDLLFAKAPDHVQHHVYSGGLLLHLIEDGPLPMLANPDFLVVEGGGVGRFLDWLLNYYKGAAECEEK